MADKKTPYHKSGKFTVDKPVARITNNPCAIYHDGKFIAQFPQSVIDSLINSKQFDSFAQTLYDTMVRLKKNEFERGQETIREGLRDLLLVPTKSEFDMVRTDVDNMGYDVRSIEGRLE
tara:strand:- start:490 stop:846 length:357 start_codon:yes stop_codon:yes gene_type:complete